MTYRAVLSFFLLVSATMVLAQSRAPVIGPVPMAQPRVPGQPDMHSTLNTSGAINGSVRTLDDQPLSNARVELRSLQTGLPVASVYSNYGGGFELYNVPPGQYDVVARLGLEETHERVEVQGTQVFVNLRMPGAVNSEAGGAATISIAQMQVPDKARKAFKKAQEEFDQHQLGKARAETETALKLYPNYAQALTLRGVIELHDEKPEQARADFEKAVECDPNYGMAFVALGSAYNTLHRWDDAARVLDRAISLAPNAWQAYFERARTLVSKQQYAAALRDLAKASQFLTKDFPVMHLVKANALIGVHDYANAQVELESFLRVEPEGSNADQARRVLGQLQAFTATARK